MSKFLRTIPVVLLEILFLSGFTGCAPTTSLAPAYQAGLHYSLKVHQSSNLMMPLPIPGVDVKESELVLDVHVLEVDAQQLVTVEVTIASIKVSLKSFSVNCSYDSENPTLAERALQEALPSKEELSDKHQQRYESAFEGLKGKTYRATVNAKGGIVGLEIEDKRLRSLADRSVKGMLGEDQLTMLLSDAALREYVVPAAVSARSKANTKNSWTGPVTIDVPRAESVDVPCTYTLDSEDPNQQVKTLNVSYTIDHALDSTGQPETQAPALRAGRRQAGGFKVVAVKGEGKMQFSPDNKKRLHDDQTLKVEVTTTNSSRRTSRSSDGDKPKRAFIYTVQRTIERIEKP